MMKKFINLTLYNLQYLYRLPTYYTVIIGYFGLFLMIDIFIHPLDPINGMQSILAFVTIYFILLKDNASNEVFWLTLLPTSLFLINLSKFLAGYISILIITLLIIVSDHFVVNYSINNWDLILSTLVTYCMAFGIYSVWFLLKGKK